MKRSEVNRAIRDATECFVGNGWALPPKPRWDVTDFGSDNFSACGLTLVNLAEEPEYCEKLMFAYPNQITPAHTHGRKKEDIICRSGQLELRLWADKPPANQSVVVRVDGEPYQLPGGDVLRLEAGSRVTLEPGIFHAFWAAAPGTIIGEVSTANDDADDNIFAEPIRRFAEIEEDEPAIAALVSDRSDKSS